MKWLKSGIFFAVVVSVWAVPVPLADENSLRLPKSSAPLSYDLTLTTNVHLGQRAFTGNVKIEIEIRELTDVITLHNRRLVVQNFKVSDQNGIEIQTQNSSETEKEFFQLTRTTGQFQQGEKYTIEIDYTGQLQTGTSGFYRSSYVVEGVTR